jgi:protocatechuate 3,4-dioxygenase beta subunit
MSDDLTPHLPDLHRRRRVVAATLAVGTGALLGSRAALLLAQESALRATPPMTLGPFYPDRLPVEQDADLTAIAGRPGRAAGQILYLAGRVLDTRGKPLPGARLELWQANSHGRYIHSGDSDASGPLDPNFQGYASLRADADGRYRIKTIKPAPYSGRTAHLHFNVDASGARLTTQMFFEGERLNERDGLYRALGRDDRRAATGRWTDRSPDMEADALAVAWDIALNPM